MENLKHLQALEESEEERKKRRCQQGAGQIGQVGAAVAMIVVGAIYHDECTYSKGREGSVQTGTTGWRRSLVTMFLGVPQMHLSCLHCQVSRQGKETHGKLLTKSLLWTAKSVCM